MIDLELVQRNREGVSVEYCLTDAGKKYINNTTGAKE